MFRVSVGSPALSAFRLEKLRNALHAVAPDVVIADVRHCYFSALKKDTLDAAQAALLGRVLSLDENLSEPAAGLVPVLVVPSLGTISPWSTKATDIARHCGIDGIARIERGVIYYFSGLSDAQRAAVLPLLHDRMTESVLDGLPGAAEKIFRHGSPQPLATVDIISGGADALVASNREMGLALSSDEIEYLV